MRDRITSKDLERAVQAHRDALERCGITFDGRLGLAIGSKTYGRAYRLYVTDFDYHCQNQKYLDFPNGRVEDWDHADCRRCNGTKREKCSGHNRPPIGDDYLGMTAREAYDALTARTRVIYDTSAALEAGGVS